MIATTLGAIGDHYGLFKELRSGGPATGAELAARSGIDLHYAREWLNAMASAGYVIYDPDGRRFALPEEHALVLADEGGPLFFGGMYGMIFAYPRIAERIVEAFRTGRGVPLSAYPDEWFAGGERMTAGAFDHFLVQQWIPAMPDVRAKLEGGAAVADVGCGRGRAMLALARAFPASRFVGYDLVESSIGHATEAATAAGVGDRVRFECRDVHDGLGETYDVITAFDVVHDTRDPLAFLRAIRQALRPDGSFVCLEFNSSEQVEENVGPLGTLLYGSSIIYCMSTSLAEGGEGLGAAGLPEPRLRRLCGEAGLGSLRRVPIDNPFNRLYEIRA